MSKTTWTKEAVTEQLREAQINDAWTGLTPQQSQLFKRIAKENGLSVKITIDRVGLCATVEGRI